MSAQFISPYDPRWFQLLSTLPHDFFHLPAYVNLMAHHEKGSPVAFIAEIDGERFFLPLIRRWVPEYLDAVRAYSDVISPYGYCTPLTSTDSPVIVARFFHLFQQTCRDHDIISAFIRLNPFFPLPDCDLSGVGWLVNHGQVVYINLCQPLQTIVTNFRRDHRKNLRRLQRAGFTAHVDDEWRFVDAFIDTYIEDMQRIGSDPFYLFERAFFEQLIDELPTQMRLITVLAPEGTLAAAALVTATGGLSHTFLSCTAKEHLKMAPSKLVIQHACQWTKECGQHMLNIGGGVKSCNDSLLYYKAGFSQLRKEYSTLRMITMPDAYDDLMAEWHMLYPEQGVDQDYFPAYRLASVYPCVPQSMKVITSI